MAHPKHTHPKLDRPITVDYFLGEFLGFWNRSGLVDSPSCPLKVIFPARLTRTHCCKSSRRYAQVAPSVLQFEFAAQTLWLPIEFREGLIVHEIGHVLAGSDPTEEGANAAAIACFGGTLTMDPRWPGKGLQSYAP